MRLISSRTTFGLVCMQLAGSALAQAGAGEPAPVDADTGGVEEIVVTAQKRSENLQTTPLAITALSATALRNAGVTDLVGVAQNTPSLTISAYPSAASTLVTYIRGQGVGDPMIVTRDGSVGVYVDGMYLSRPQSMAFDLADVERVEVLRGPQGTLYGRNTTGGAVNIISKKPTGQFGVDGTVDYGRFDYHREFVNVNLPAIGDLAAKVTVLNTQTDGWVENSGAGTGVPEANDFNLRDQKGARLALLWTPTGDVTIDYSGDIGQSKTTPAYYVSDALVGVIPGYSNDPSRTYRPIYLPESDSKTDGHALTASWEVSPDLTLRSLTSYRHLDYFSYQDYAETFFVPFLSPDQIVSRTYTQELQAVGALFDKKIEYVAGLYYFREKAGHHNAYDINPSPAYLGGANNTLILKDRQVDAVSESRAVYGQLTWHPPVLEERLSLTVGARYTEDERRATRDASLVVFTADPGSEISPLTNRRFLGPGTYFDTGTTSQSNKESWHRFNPSVTLDFEATPDLNVYAKYATGYKAGGFTEATPNFDLTFAPETVDNYEVGLKSDLFDQRVRFNLAAFRAEFSDFQLDFQIDPNDPSVIQIINAGSAKVEGFEAELTARPIRTLTLGASYSYLKQSLEIAAPAGTIFDPAINPSSPTAVGGDISDYFRIPFTPKQNFSLNADWTLFQFDSSDIKLYAAYTYRGELYSSAGSGPAVPNNQYYQRPSYETVDARLTYRCDLAGDNEVSVSVWGKNIFDDRHPDDFVIGNGSILDGYGSQARPYATPATYGVQLGYRF